MRARETRVSPSRAPVFIVPTTSKRLLRRLAIPERSKPLAPVKKADQFRFLSKLPTYPSPKPTLSLTSHLGHNVGLGEG